MSPRVGLIAVLLLAQSPGQQRCLLRVNDHPHRHTQFDRSTFCQGIGCLAATITSINFTSEPSIYAMRLPDLWDHCAQRWDLPYGTDSHPKA
ncbi:hypothetical protein JAAARDRAFT_660161 [Jaapia argillacea MUCL 33604]|uniref:Secreted protein n=1 Tax=Jaapia argillacea MUCL 33604 TaxID=933084 RepID=A0A067PWZ6_9AGAM|nr:hypothetical protein JAAARDRAFT_660161 [Jaapia argillacea MUCL 33604]